MQHGEAGGYEIPGILQTPWVCEEDGPIQNVNGKQ